MRTRRAAARTGVTLLELLVVLVILGVTAGLSGPALTRMFEERPPSFTARIADARRQAIGLGQPVMLTLHDSLGTHVVRVLPNGSVLGASSFAVDWISGRPTHAAQ